MKFQFLMAPLLVLAACKVDEPTYHGDVKAIIDEKCATCHFQGGIGPFALTTYDETYRVRDLVAHSVSVGTMPPWPPSDECNEFLYERSLAPDEYDLVMAWAEGKALEGKVPEDYTPPPAPESLDTDVVLNLKEPYAPEARPDDYRCHVLEWPNTETSFVTGYEVHPDQAQLVHHVIAFGIPPEQADAVRGFDEAEDGPGYTCFGSPYPSDSGVNLSGFAATRWLGSWAPGGGGRGFPEGTGIKMEPGSLVVIQVHYNTITAEPVPDDSSMSFRTSDTVDRQAIILPFTNPLWVMGSLPMSIPAGESSVTHKAAFDLVAADVLSRYGSSDLDGSMGIEVHNVGLHMHELGKQAKLSIQRSDGTNECLVHIPDWDFGWQGGYFLKEPTVMYAGDKLSIECEWDNSAENQPIVDGEKLEPKDVEWGEGTGDEMCLGILYLTEPL